MPRKKQKGGRRNFKKSVNPEPSVSVFNGIHENNQSLATLRNWIENVNKNKDDFQIKDELEEIEEEFLNEEEFECNIKELEKPMRCLLRKCTDAQIKRTVKIECEWKKCPFETLDDQIYLSHVSEHFKSMEIDEEEEMSCNWDLCQFKSPNRNEFFRHLHYHAYHTTLKTFGYGLYQIINIPVCQGDSKFRNLIPDLNDYFCYWDECRDSFVTITEFIEHVNDHISELVNNSSIMKYSQNETKMKDVKVSCQWSGCGKLIANVFELKRHLRVHSQQKIIGCPNCGQLFSTKLLFINHCVRQVVGQRTFKCPECVKFYPSEKLLKEHVRSHINKFQCAICGLSCQKKSVLARHIRYRHIDMKSFACTECEYRGTTQADLDSHSNKHKPGHFFKCDVFQCNYSCRTLMALKRHDAKEHLGQPQTYVCHIYNCSKKFLRGYLLTKHLKTNHDFILAPGHSRFIYKLEEDGFYRLQTKRVENLKETTFTGIKMNSSANYKIETIPSTSTNDIINIKFTKTEDEPTQKLLIVENENDINNFTIMKNYRRTMKKK